MSHSVCVGKGWFIAGSVLEWGGERVKCICVFYVFVVEMHKNFFFLLFLSSLDHLICVGECSCKPLGNL